MGSEIANSYKKSNREKSNIAINLTLMGETGLPYWAFLFAPQLVIDFSTIATEKVVNLRKDSN